jgi:hypothetical protein
VTGNLQRTRRAGSKAIGRNARVAKTGNKHAACIGRKLLCRMREQIRNRTHGILSAPCRIPHRKGKRIKMHGCIPHPFTIPPLLSSAHATAVQSVFATVHTARSFTSEIGPDTLLHDPSKK